MMSDMNIGEARRHAIRALSEILADDEDIARVVLGHDLFGRLRVILWLRPGADEERARSRASAALAPCGHLWTGDVWISSPATMHADNLIYESAWDEGVIVPGVDALRIDDRARTRTGWLPHFRSQEWNARRDWQSAVDTGEAASGVGPPVLVFYSFKGGVGRTTALASFAIQRAREGERVLVIDFDLDAPGAGTLLSPDDGDAPRGVVDYLLEEDLGDVDIGDFTHTCRRSSLVGDAGGEIVVMAAGRVDEDYLVKLSRVDLEIHGVAHPLSRLLDDARKRLRPHWILLDSRAGLSPAAGILLDGIAHLHVLFGTNSAQSQMGLTQVIRHLGEERVLRDLPQGRCILVQAMIVDIVDVEKAAKSQFNIWLERTLRDHYVVPAEDDPEDRLWSVRDLGSPESPNQAVPIPYRPRLAFFPSIDDVAADLVAGPYVELATRILMQFNGLGGVGEES